MQTRFIILISMVLGLPVVARGELTKHSDQGSYGCRRSFGYGVYDAAANKTVICWNGEKMSIHAREFDHATKRWSEPVKVLKLNFSRRNDYHNYPCIVRAPDGHYLIFYFKHCHAAYMLRSPAAGTVAGVWSHEKISDDKCSYAMSTVVGDTTYLFYSSTAARWHRPYRMIQSADSGKTWSEPVTLIDSGHRQKEKYDEVYLHGFSIDQGGDGKPARVLLGWEMVSGPLGHNRGGYGNFFAYFNCENQKMYAAGGKDLGSTVDLGEIYDDCVINDTKDPNSRLFGYTTFPEVLPDGSVSVLYTLHGKNYVAHWKQNAWATSEIKIDGKLYDYQRTDQGTYVILSGSNKRTTVWESGDGLTDWKIKSVTKLPTDGNNDSATKGFIDGFQSAVQWMAATYNMKKRKKDYSGKWPVYTFGVKKTQTGLRQGKP
ncbi:MAG: BNR-4 repeat-containing protein [Planctomycetia bacterium]